MQQAAILLARTPSLDSSKINIYVNKTVYKWTRSKYHSPAVPVKVICRLKQGMYTYMFLVAVILSAIYIELSFVFKYDVKN